MKHTFTTFIRTFNMIRKAQLWYVIGILTVAGCLAEDCPPPQDLGPCECHIDSQGLLALRCQQVEGWEDVYFIFDTGEVSHFSSVDIMNSPGLTDVPELAFSDVKIDAIRFFNTGLVDLRKNLFSNATATSLKTFYIKHNSEFTTLENDVLAHLSGMEALYVSYNNLGSLTGEMLIPSIPYIDLSHNHITQIPTNYFAGISSLNVVLLSFNELTSDSVAEGSFTFYDIVEDFYLDLAFNLLSEGVPMTAFGGEVIPKELILSYNNINFLNESTYAPLIDSMFVTYGTDSYILLDGNDLECGCEMAWIIDHEARDLLQKGTCDDGRLVSGLTRADFVDC